jgi:hypothetical protein
MTKEEYKMLNQIIKKEIKYCNKYIGNINDTFAKGFREGLIQSLYLIREVYKSKKSLTIRK